MKPYTIDDAEAELRVAIDADDREAIARLEPIIDALDVKREPPTLLASALWYAELGIPTFAILPGRKHPFGRCEECKVEPKCPGPHACGHDQCHGLLDATTDPDRLRRWWDAAPKANVGLATGHLFDVVDIDGPLGQASRTRHWDDIFGQIDADNIAKVLTPRPGGMHIYVPPTTDGNATGIVDGVDYRGTGGYVLAPPSVIAPGSKDTPGCYRFLGTPGLAAVAKVA